MPQLHFQKVYIEITNRCNLHCSFCPPTRRPACHMSTLDFAEVVRRVRPYTDYICLHVKGEPLLHPDFESILKIAHEAGLKVNLTTNATLLPFRENILTGPYAPRQISLSLHSFDANDLGIKDLAEYQTAFDRYLENAISFAKHFTQAIPGYISFRLWNLADDAGQDQYDRNRFILHKLEKAYGLTSHVDSHTGKFQGNAIADRTYLNFDHLFDWPDLSSPVYEETGTCYGLRHQLAILVDGSVVPCCLDGEGIMTLGNIFQEDLQTILGKEKSRQIIEGFRQHKLAEELCRHCGYRTRFQPGTSSILR